jgi:hypothetical protein
MPTFITVLMTRQQKSQMSLLLDLFSTLTTTNNTATSLFHDPSR